MIVHDVTVIRDAARMKANFLSMITHELRSPLNAINGYLDLTLTDIAGELNEQQHAAVTAPPGPALVIAGAGSGKTRTLTYRVAYLLEQGIPADRVLLLTFTNKAAKEMMRRVSEKMASGQRYTPRCSRSAS